MPIQLDVVFRSFWTKFFEHAIVRRRNQRAFTGDLCSHALGDFAGCPPINQDVELRLALDIDKPRSYDQSGCIYGLFCFRTVQIPDGGDSVSGNTKITMEPGCAGSIDDFSVGDQEVIDRLLSMVFQAAT